MKKNRTYNRILSGILTLVTLISLIPVQVFSTGTETAPVEVSAPAENFVIRVDGEAKSTLSLRSYEKIEISAEGLLEDAKYQWQILHPEKPDVWVNIYDATRTTLPVTLALVKNMLGSGNTTQLRCRATAEGAPRYTPAITVSYEEEPVETVAVEEPLPQETIAPTEPTEPAETVAATEATEPVETVAATEATEPAETVAATETTEPVETVAATEATEPAETVAATESTEPVETVAVTEATEPVETVAVTESTEPVETVAATEATEPAETVAATESTEPVETVEATEATESAEVPEETAAVTEPVAEVHEQTSETQPAGKPELSAAPEKLVLSGMTLFGAPAVAAEDEFVKVTIEYVYFEYKRDENGKLVIGTDGNPVLNDGEQAFNSYIATLQKGTGLNTTVPVPTMVGYDAYLGNGTETITEVKIGLGSIQEDITYTVNYKPAQVSYTVRYYFQNVYDDLYVENTAQKLTSTGATGTTPPVEVLNKEFPGFLSLYYQPDYIAADGSTVFEVYYERNYYLMEFDCNGGYGTDTLYIRYGTYISVPNPVRSGYLFGGWDLIAPEDPDNSTILNDGNANELPETMPPYNMAYKAIWNQAKTSYTIIYWRANLATENDANGNTTYSYWGRETVTAQSADDLIPSEVGSTYLATTINSDEDFDTSEAPYYTYDAVTTAENNPDTVKIEGDGTTVINVYYNRKIFEIRYIFARQNGQTYQIATLTKNGVVGNWGTATVSSLPTIKADSGFDVQTERIGQYTYYYIALRAEYGANIESKWPGAVMNSTEYYSFGSWAAEDGTGYRNKDTEHANIVGPYPYMSAEMVKKGNEEIAYTDEETGETYYVAQRMSAWWGNTWNNISTHRYHIYYEVLSGTGDREYNGKQYKLVETQEFVAAHNDTTRVDPFYYTGYECINDTRIYGIGDDKDYQQDSNNYKRGTAYYMCPDNSCDYCNCFFYDRVDYTLSFYNHNTLSNEAGKTFPSVSMAYEQKIKDALPAAVDEPYQPAYPEGIEPNAYEFMGWYTTADCIAETAVDWESTMPAGDLTLYAKWEPVKRNVIFYVLYDDIDKKEDDEDYVEPFLTANNVPHGTRLDSAYTDIPSAEDDPRIEGYTFIGWFYMDEDNKKRFAPDSMEITRDLVLFAEWTTQIDTTYEIQYVLRDEYINNDSGVTYPKGTPVAESIFAHSSVGKTKTFTAKGTTELLPAFQTGFFPTTNSHSILMDKDSINNTYTFEYVYDDAVWYKVRYLEVSTNKELHAEKKISTQQAVVTEKFLPIPGYIPQNYYIRKTLAYDENATEPIEENVITFYYVKDEDHGMYSIEYYLENADSLDDTNRENYTQYESIVGTADLKDENGKPNTITAPDKSYEGYTYQANMSQVITYEDDGTPKDPVEGTSGTVSANGLTIKLYYKRNSYPYVIEYREYGAADTAKSLWSQESEAKFGTEIEYSLVAEDRDHRIYIAENGNTYEYYISNATPEEYTRSTTIRAFEEGEDNPNKLIFYFIQKKVEVFYHAVCTDQAATDFGVVSLNSETASAAEGLAGSTATAKTGFEFKGWYKDKEGTERVDATWLTGNHLKPKELTQNGKWENHYYALFEPVRKDLKIVKEGTGIDSGDSFIFTVSGTNVLGKKVSMMVSIQGTGSVTIQDLYCGNYTVTETNWSWGYSCTGVSLDAASQPAGNDCEISLTNGSEETTTVTFTNKPKNVDWLHGESCKENVFKAFQTTN